GRQLERFSRCLSPIRARHLEIALDGQILQPLELFSVLKYLPENRHGIERAEELFTDVKLRQAGELELERLLIGRREVGLAQRRGKESFALVVEFFVVENRIHLRAEEDAEPATLLHVCFKVGELLVGQLTNVEQEDARKLPDVGPLQRFGGDAAAKLVAVD